MKKQEFIAWEKNMDYLRNMKKYRYDDISLDALKRIQPKTRVLSCGCGPGREVRFLVQNKKCKVTAIDISQNMINESKKQEPNARYLCRDFTTFINRERFDYITCLWNTMNFLSYNERKRFIENSYLNLKKGGLLIITSAHRFSSPRIFLKTLFEGKATKEYYYSNTHFSYSKKRQHTGAFLIIARKIKQENNKGE